MTARFGAQFVDFDEDKKDRQYGAERRLEWDISPIDDALMQG